MFFESAAITDIGRVRRQNEDRFLLLNPPGFFGVADGIGGLPAGALAAQATVDELAAGIDAPTLRRPGDLIALLHRVNHHVQGIGGEISPGVGIGCTLTCGLFQSDRVWIAHVGDSRCLLLRDGAFTLLTEDHSVENEARRRRARGEQITVHERYRAALTRCIGQVEPPEVDVIEQELRPGDQILFATDGVTRVIGEAELAGLLDTDRPQSDRLADLIELVNRRGGPDNATAVLVACHADRP